MTAVSELSTILSKTARNGDVETVRVVWKPLDITWMTPEFENVGRRVFAFDTEDEPPVDLVEYAGVPIIEIRERIVNRNGKVDTPTRVNTKHLRRGEYRIEDMDGNVIKG